MSSSATNDRVVRFGNLSPVRTLSAAAVLFLTTAGASAQGANALLSGMVRDSSGQLVAHARVTAVEESRSAQRLADSNDAGLYTLPQLPAGRYSITVEAPGFAPTRRVVMLTVGERASVDVTLQVQATTADVTVETSEVTLEREDPSLSAVTGPRAIEQLPLNGRDTTQLALLSPGVVPSRRVNPDSQGLGRQISIEGRRPNQVAFLLDGTDVNDAYNNTPGGASGVIPGVDSIAQFRVLTNGYGAEYGRTSGGVIDEITRSGTNKLHGSAFEFVRNSALDAKNYFDSKTLAIPAFTRNQFGGSAGGPIGKSQTFFFGNYEGLRQDLGLTTQALVPNATSRATGVAAVQPFLAVIPTPNSTVFTDGTGIYQSTNTAVTGEDFFVARVDHQHSDRTSYFARFQFDNANVRTPDSLQLSASHNRSRAQYATAQLTHSFSQRLVNQSRASYNRSYYTLEYNILKSLDPSLSFVPGNPFGSISITGLAMIGPMRFGPNVNVLNLFQGSDDLTLTAGRHTLALGFDEKQILFPQEAAQSQNGFYQFTSVANFMAARPSAVEIALPGSNPRRHWRQHMESIYLTDTYRASQSLNLTLGLRYERASVPSEEDGLQATVRNILTDKADTVGPLYTNPANLNLAPRAGFAYSPGRASTTTIRGAFGIYFDPLWTDFYLNSGSRQPPFFTVGSVANPVFPRVSITPANFVLGRIDVVQYHPASPYVMQWNANVQQQVARGAVLTLAYSANRGVHDQRITDENQALPQIVNGRKFFPLNSTVRNTAFTAIRYKQTNGLSSYHALRATLDYRFHNFVQLRSTYTWSKALDTSSLVTAQGTENDVPQDPDSLAAEKGLSNYDLRHYSSTSITTDLPRFRGPKWLAAGWQANGIMVLSSGAPFSTLVSYDSARARFGTGPSPERPDLVPGRSSNPIKGGPVQYFDPTAFTLPTPGYYGNLGRNTLIGPGLISIDGAINKSFLFGERSRLQLRAEVFNIPNRANFAIPSQRNVFSNSTITATTDLSTCVNNPTARVIGGACTLRVASAGLITNTLTSSRQIQLGARFDF
ncbi:MAG: TonB-dependent receptor [Janthinobacterium lividum]